MPEAGWYRPEDEPAIERWWDGEQWTDHRRQPDAAAGDAPQQAWSDDLEAPEPSGLGFSGSFAAAADRITNWVNRRAWWATALLWLLGFMFLLPLRIVAKTGGSRNGLIGAGVLFVLFLGMGAASQEPPDTDPLAAEGSVEASPSPSPLHSPSPSRSPSPSPSPSPSQSPSPSPSPTEESASPSPRDDDAPVVKQGRVVDIVDGDTFDLSDGTRVRIAIADTPEVYGGIEECGPEASDFAGSFLAGQTVAIYRPEGAPEFDSFDRMLGEAVRVSDGASLNVALVRAGLARIDERFTDEDPDLTERLRAAQAEAEDPRCEPQSEPEPEAEPVPEPEPTTEQPEPTENPNADHGGKTDGGWECHPAYYECLPKVNDLNCGDVRHSVTVFDPNYDPYGLDGNDHDGKGCESESAWSSSKTYPYY